VANLSASRASYAAVRKMRIWGAEGYASLDFAAGRATRVRPSEPLRRGRVDLDGVDLAQPAAIKEHLFGKILRVDHLEGQPGEPLALELENFVRAVRGLEPPRVSGEDALRALRLAEQVLRSLEGHHWEPQAAAAHSHAPTAEAASILLGPHAWRIKSLRPSSQPSGQ
jgi:predicted dehydrogenase